MMSLTKKMKQLEALVKEKMYTNPQDNNNESTDTIDGEFTVEE